MYIHILQHTVMALFFVVFVDSFKSRNLVSRKRKLTIALYAVKIGLDLDREYNLSDSWQIKYQEMALHLFPLVQRGKKLQIYKYTKLQLPCKLYNIKKEMTKENTN